ncbi:MAG: hypothetical protein ACYC6M_12885, partial [Terriglobales bacterium]
MGAYNAMTLNPNRPNTGVTDEFLQENVILCCGEDPLELVEQVKSFRPIALHKYRCYRFWRFPAFSLIWTGIGTGCLEPLLFEIYMPFIVRNIILIGTAGAVSSIIPDGQAFCIKKAYSRACAVRTKNPEVPLFPHWKPPLPEDLQEDAATIVSTDYYYGFSTLKDP